MVVLPLMLLLALVMVVVVVVVVEVVVVEVEVVEEDKNTWVCPILMILLLQYLHSIFFQLLFGIILPNLEVEEI
jgi:hypothetical protein